MCDADNGLARESSNETCRSETWVKRLTDHRPIRGSLVSERPDERLEDGCSKLAGRAKKVDDDRRAEQALGRKPNQKRDSGGPAAASVQQNRNNRNGLGGVESWQLVSATDAREA